MIFGATERVSSLDRLVARWEVGRLAVVPFTLSILSVWPLMVGPITLKAVTGVRPVVPTLVILACWAVLAALDLGAQAPLRLAALAPGGAQRGRR